MKLLVLSVIAAIVVAGSFYHMANVNTDSGVPSHIQDAYEHWKLEQGRLYGTITEDTYRLRIFAENYEQVRAHNAENSSSTLELNMFADLSSTEFESQYLRSPMP